MNVCDFGSILRQLRQSRNLTQAELGKNVRLSKAVISKYELSLGYPTFDVLIRIADFFGVSTDYLLGVSKGKTIDVSNLSDSQIAALHHIIVEFSKTNNSTK